MKRKLLAAFLYVLSVPSHAALYTISWDNTAFYPTDTATFTSQLTPYLAVYGQNFSHVHQQLTVGGQRPLFIPIGWANDQWLQLDGTNSLEYRGWITTDPNLTLHTVTVTPGLPGIVSHTPEPATMVMLALGLAALGIARKVRV